MRQLRVRLSGLLIAGLLTACSSTLPQAASTLRPGAMATATSIQPDTQNTIDSAAESLSDTPTPAVTPTPGDGPITASMEKLKIDGERYATMGDPSAPITLVEFSDYG